MKYIFSTHLQLLFSGKLLSIQQETRPMSFTCHSAADIITHQSNPRMSKWVHFFQKRKGFCQVPEDSNMKYLLAGDVRWRKEKRDEIKRFFPLLIPSVAGRWSRVPVPSSEWVQKELFSLRSREDLREGSPNHESFLCAWDSVLFA